MLRLGVAAELLEASDRRLALFPCGDHVVGGPPEATGGHVGLAVGHLPRAHVVRALQIVAHPARHPLVVVEGLEGDGRRERACARACARVHLSLCARERVRACTSPFMHACLCVSTDALATCTCLDDVGEGDEEQAKLAQRRPQRVAHLGRVRVRARVRVKR